MSNSEPALPLALSAALTADTWPSCSFSSTWLDRTGNAASLGALSVLLTGAGTCCWDNVSLGVGMTCPGREQR